MDLVIYIVFDLYPMVPPVGLVPRAAPTSPSLAFLGLAAAVFSDDCINSNLSTRAV